MAIYYIWGSTASVAPDRIGNAQLVPDTEYDALARTAALEVGDFDVESHLLEGKPGWAGAYETPGDDALDPGSDRHLVKGSIDGDGG